MIAVGTRLQFKRRACAWVGHVSVDIKINNQVVSSGILQLNTKVFDRCAQIAAI